MSTTVGRNSLIMACGTAASRVTGQIRTIFLVGALGTTGIAANAYQAGAQIPQVIFNLLSTGIFNAVLVPQIVRTLKEDDAEDRLNKLITLSGVLLLAITLLMMAGTPLLTALYLDSSWNPAQRALANAFTLWCMPQILFYGLYTVLGQILAAKGRFATYAWSSVGANVVSCIGFGAFIALFGNAGRQPMEFWTPDKVALTAGAWTAGVAFQALILFVPLFRLGLRYRPRWGVHGLGLRSMGQVAVWSMAMVVLNQFMGIVNSRVNTGAPTAGGDLYGIAGNASYQYAYTIYILPYSIIAVSITTAVFPRLSRAISEQRIADARADLSSSLRTTGLAMIFFTAAMVAMPVPLVKALIPSATLHGAVLISGPLIGLMVGLVPTSAFLLVQRSFYAYEDGKSPFLFSAVDNAVQLTLLLVALRLTQPKDWVLMVALSLSLSYVITFPWVFWLLRRRFGGRLDGRRIVTMHVKAAIAGVCAGACGLLFNPLVTHMVGASVDGGRGHMNWAQSIVICAVLTIIVAAVYAALLWMLRVSEFTDLVDSVMHRVRRRGASSANAAGTDGGASTDGTADGGAGGADGGADGGDNGGDNGGDGPAPAAGTTGTVAPADAAPSTDDNASNSDNAASDDNGTDSPATGTVDEPSMLAQTPTDGAASELADHAQALPLRTTIPTTTMSAMPQPIHHRSAPRTNRGTMKPQLGDTVVGRYTLVSSLREETGLSAWIVTDRMLAQDCQMFIINDESILPQVNAAASALVLANSRYCTRVLQLQHVGDIALVITEEDAGLSLTEYMTGESGKFLSFEAIRSVLCQTTEAVQELLDTNLLHTALSTDTIRVSIDGIQLADTPIVSALVDVCNSARTENTSYEEHVIRQLSAVLYALLTHTPSSPDMTFDLAKLPADTPPEFLVICKRGLGLQDTDGNTAVPMVSLAEFSALLGSWIPFNKLQEHDIALPAVAGTASIVDARMNDLSGDDIVELPDDFAVSQKLPDLAISAAGRTAGAEARFEQEQRRLQEAFIGQLPGDVPSELPVIDKFEQPLPLPEPDTAAPNSTLAALQSKVGHIVSFWHKDGEPAEDNSAEQTMFEVADDALPITTPPSQPMSFPPTSAPQARPTEAELAGAAPAANGQTVPAAGAPYAGGPSGYETMLIPPATDAGVASAAPEGADVLAEMPVDSPFGAVSADGSGTASEPLRRGFSNVVAGSTGEVPQVGTAGVPGAAAGSAMVGAVMPPSIPPAYPPSSVPARGSAASAHATHSPAALEAFAAHTDAATEAAAHGAPLPNAAGTQAPVRVPVSRSRMTAPIQRADIAAMNANIDAVNALDSTTAMSLPGMTGTPIEPLPPTMPPSFAPTQVHQHAAEMDDEAHLPDKPLWNSLPVRITVILIALVVMVGLFVLAYFSLNNSSDNGNSLKDEQYNKSDLNNVPFGDSDSNSKSSKSAALSPTDIGVDNNNPDIITVRVL
ncbi:virulence factor protein [Bifidobacterium goeldii]|uniref:Virulence factor protein n=1 Tax=Bifidobacterium goeldii TaxID=2306975 RepID=A0A430FH34_9BIFI|nr:murein biosynthesis integral membrane protein MurJ [Bifidobacterium goeldii]RSX52156.1 virulence factor protein [Bifidobacterium goeldii]